MLILFAAIQFTNIVDFMIMMPLAPALMRIMHISTRQFGLVVSAYTITAGFSGLFSAMVIDRFDRKHALQALYIGFGIGTICCGLAPNYWFLLMARILTGFFGGVLGALVLASVSDLVPYDRRASAMGIITTAFSMATILGVPMGLFVSNLYGWHWPFLGLGILALLFSGLIYFFIPNMKEHLKAGKPEINPIATFGNILRNPNQLYALLLMSLLMLGHFSIIPFLSKYAVSNMGFTEHQLTFIYLFGGIATIVTAPLTGKLADRYGKKLIFRIALPISLIPVILLTNMGKVPIPYVLMVTTLFFITATARMIPMQALVSSTVNPQQRGAFMSVNGSMQQFSAGIASLLAGLIVVENADKSLLHYNYVGYFAVVMLLLTLWAVGKVKSGHTP